MPPPMRPSTAPLAPTVTGVMTAPLAPSATAIGVAPIGPPVDRASEMPPTSSLTAAMLIPRPSNVAPAPTTPGRSGDAGDPLRERLATVEVQSSATRSIATRIETEANRAHSRIDAIESSVRDRVHQLGEAIDGARKAIEARIDEILSAGVRPTMPMHVETASLEALAPENKGGDVAGLKTALATLRQTVAEHDRQFEARRARVESLETRVAAVEGDPRVVELRRAVEGFDLRLRALERSQETLRSDVDARVTAMEARLAEASASVLAKKTVAPDPELRRIKGVGPKYEKALREIGITTIAQVAAMGDDELTRVAAQLSVPVERVRKLGWPDIARGLLEA